MSLIIAYMGKKGCVMASDKRRIAYFGDKDNRELLEQEIYSGTLTNDTELYNRAEELDIVLKVSDDASKIKTVEDVVVGEVSSKGTSETKRKRIYGTTNGFQIVQLSGSEIISVEKGSSSIILFGNKITKKLASEALNKKWKASFSLKYMGELFGEIIEDISSKTPSLGKQYDVLIKNPKLSKDETQKYLDNMVDMDVKLLAKFRSKLREDLFKQNEIIKLAATIVEEGSIGKIISIDDNIIHVKLNSDIRAFDTNWKLLSSPNEEVVMFVDNGSASIGDEIVIENETLGIKGKSVDLSCNIILCHLK